MPEKKKVASTGDQTRNHQVMSPTRSPLSHPGGAPDLSFFAYVPCLLLKCRA